MCQMHKSNSAYGTLLLNQKFKQTGKQTENFALYLAKILPFTLEEILHALDELIDENILRIDGDMLICERMLRDGKLSATRSITGSLGGKNRKKQPYFASPFADDFAIPKTEANTGIENGIGIENGNEFENEIEIGKGGVGEKPLKGVSTVRQFQPPEVGKVAEYFATMMCEFIQAELFWNYYQSQGWRVGKNKMKDWRAAARGWIVRHKAGQFGNGGKSEETSKMSRIAQAGAESLSIEVYKP